MDKKTNRWIIAAVVVAVVAALAAIAMYVLRARTKKKAWYEQDAMACDGECECFEFDDEDDIIETAEVIE